jgi:hypothetical protein
MVVQSLDHADKLPRAPAGRHQIWEARSNTRQKIEQ